MLTKGYTILIACYKPFYFEIEKMCKLFQVKYNWQHRQFSVVLQIALYLLRDFSETSDLLNKVVGELLI